MDGNLSTGMTTWFAPSLIQSQKATAIASAPAERKLAALLLDAFGFIPTWKDVS